MADTDCLGSIREKFGLDSVREFQCEVLKQVVDGGDAFLSCKTGSGKSLCYQAFPEYWGSIHSSAKCIVLVVTPLVAIMKEQVAYLRTLGYSATYIGEDSKNDQSILQGNYTFLFSSPESIVGDSKWRDMILSPPYQNDLQLIAIDEGHTLLQWGVGKGKEKPFREWFGHVGELRSLLPRCPILVLTATASQATRQKIKLKLGLRQPLMKVDNPDRENIKLFVKKEKVNTALEDMFFWLIDMIRCHGKACPRYLVFCKTIKDCALVYSCFRVNLEDSQYCYFNMYHSMTDERVKDDVRRDMAHEDGDIRVLVCTSSAGMGVNFKGVNDIVHFGPPMDIDTFTQQIGRAGRLNEKSRHLLLYHSRQLRNIDGDMLEYCKNDSNCRREILLKHYSYHPTEVRDLEQCCDVCGVPDDHPFFDEDEDDLNIPDVDIETITKEQALALKQNLELYMQSEAEHRAVPSEALHSDSSVIIQDIMTYGYLAKSPDDLLEKCNLSDFQQAAAVFNILVNTLDIDNFDSDIEDYLEDDD